MRVENRKARFDYEVLETFEAGVVLTGAEVKSAKEGAINLTGSRVIVGEEGGGREGIWLIGAQVSPYKRASNDGYDPKRSRKLLLKKKEVEYLRSKLLVKGLTVVPLSWYTKGELIKVEIALVRGKKQYEKREVEKKREEVRKIQKMLKNQKA